VHSASRRLAAAARSAGRASVPGSPGDGVGGQADETAGRSCGRRRPPPGSAFPGVCTSGLCCTGVCVSAGGEAADRAGIDGTSAGTGSASD
jgi:hypothetical protein